MGNRYWKILKIFSVIMFVLASTLVFLGETSAKRKECRWWRGVGVRTEAERSKINVPDKDLRPSYDRKAS